MAVGDHPPQPHQPRRLMAAHRPLTALHGTLALVLMALWAHGAALPAAGWLALLLALASRWLNGRPRLTSQLLRLGLLTLSVVACGFSYGWLSSPTLRLSLLLVLALKWAESTRANEWALVASAALVAIAIGLLQWGLSGSLLMLLPTLILLLATCSALANGHPGPAMSTPQTQGQAQAHSLPPSHPAPHPAPLLRWRASGRQLLMAVPLTAVLFLFFPRIPGPLWDIGLSFGLPLPVHLEASRQGPAMVGRLKPGQIQSGATNGEPVLVAEFEQEPPPLEQLYWRGPVFYDFDGQEWHLDESHAANRGRQLMRQGWRRGSEFRQTLASASQEIRYRIRLAPHHGLLLYALDLPARLPAESFIGPDWQVLSHTPIEQESQYRLSSWLEWQAQPQLTDSQRSRALALPADSNPRLQALGRQLRAQEAADPLSAALQLLRDGPYSLSEHALPHQATTRHALDALWFDDQRGNSELYAAAFVVLMRAAGVPARLVTGYRGGKPMALTNYVIVKRNHSHAWSEVWRPDLGWQRIDPAAALKPPPPAASAASRRPQARPQPLRTQHADAASAMLSTPQEALSLRQGQAAAPQTSDSLSELIAGMSRWLVQLDGQRQKTLLGQQGGAHAWLWLLALAAVGSAVVLGLQMLWRRGRAQRQLPAAERLWQRACQLLARRGWPIGRGECPSRYAQRLSATQPALADSLPALANAYLLWRYGRPADASRAASHLRPALRQLQQALRHYAGVSRAEPENHS